MATAKVKVSRPPPTPDPGLFLNAHQWCLILSSHCRTVYFAAVYFLQILMYVEDVESITLEFRHFRGVGLVEKCLLSTFAAQVRILAGLAYGFGFQT